jgi:hypothetical protein
LSVSSVAKILHFAGRSILRANQRLKDRAR